jgi:hypothetical protein
VSYQDIWSELTGAVPRIDPILAQKLVNRAWSRLLEQRTWSFLRGVGILVAPQIITAGTATVTQFSNSVQLDATARTAVLKPNNPLLTQRQFRCGLGGGAVYSITNYVPNTGILTLDRLYMEPNGVGQPYQIYRCYFAPSDLNGNYTTDFLMWKAVLNPTDGYAIVGANLRLTRQELDARDPTRGAQDLAYTMAAYNVDQNGMPFYEMWPHPTSQRAYIGLYQRRGMPLSDTVPLPSTMKEHVVVQASLDLAYDWAIGNAGRFPELKGVDWELLKAENSRKQVDDLLRAKVQDDNIELDNYLPNLRDYLSYPPIDSDFMQSHDLGEWFD